jgi:DNA-binding NtrC family response regulator
MALVDFFVGKFNKKLDLAIGGMDHDVKEMLLRYRWPGNIRELENLIERMMLMAKSPTITTCEVPPEFKTSLEQDVAVGVDGDKKPFKDFVRAHMENVEKQMIIKCLEESEGNVTKAAKLLGLSRKGLQLKMIKYNLRK